MVTPQSGEIAYTIQKLYLAQLNAVTNVYGTPVQFDYVQDSELNGEYDTDEIKAGGMIRELLTVQTASMLKFNEAWFPTAAMTAITNETETTSGATSGQQSFTRVQSGAGSGLPYIGIAGSVAATNGSYLAFGIAKCKANKKPDFKFEQNKFRTSEIEFKVASATPAVNKLLKIVRFDRIDEIPDFTDQAQFQAFMAELFS